ncbi:MAG: hypothetical protein QXQ77_01950 [Candidatus Aenigmatarchaeota archaeon]
MEEFFILKEFVLLIGISFALIWIFLGILGILLTFQLLKYLTKKEEVSMVSFFLESQKTFHEIKLMHYSCIIFLIGSIFAFPYFFLSTISIEPILLVLSLLFHVIVMSCATIYAMFMVLIFFRWFRRFRKYA